MEIWGDWYLDGFNGVLDLEESAFGAESVYTTVVFGSVKVHLCECGSRSKDDCRPGMARASLFYF